MSFAGIGALRGLHCGDHGAEAVGVREGVDAGRLLPVGRLVVGQELLGLGIGQVVGRGHVDDDGALSGVPGDLGERYVLVGVAADERRAHVELLHLGADEPTVGVVAGEVEHVGVHRLDLGEHRRVVLRSGSDEARVHQVAAIVLDGLDDRIGEPLGEAGVVGQHGDALELLAVHQVGGRELRLGAVGRGVAEEGLVAARGQLVAGAVGGLDDVGPGVDGLGRQRGAAGVGADDGQNTFVDELTCADGGLRRLAAVVAGLHFDRAAQQAALVVDLLGDQLDALLDALPLVGVLARDRRLHADHDGIGGEHRAGSQRQRQRHQDRDDHLPGHESSHSPSALCRRERAASSHPHERTCRPLGRAAEPTLNDSGRLRRRPGPVNACPSRASTEGALGPDRCGVGRR